MKKVLLINGSLNKNSCASTAMDEVISVLNKSGIATQLESGAWFLGRRCKKG